MTQNIVRNQDHLDWDAVRRCEAVQDLSRFTPVTTSSFEPIENMLLRIDEVVDGMKVAVQRQSQTLSDVMI